MHHNLRNFLAGLVLIAGVILVLYLLPHKISAPITQTLVTDFKSCAAAGYQIVETDPASCVTPDGRTFGDVVSQADVIVTTPKPNDLVTSPMTVTGKAVGTWFFEANLPIELDDANGNTLTRVGYHTSENWMTSGYIDIDTTLQFSKPTTSTGFLVIHNDNPSGDPANEKTFKVPVRFK